MVRIFKHYNFQYTDGPLKSNLISFSSYAGPITSTDDYYLINKSLAVQETTTAVLDSNQYSNKLSMDEYFPDFYRISIANHLSNSGREWSHWF